MINDNVHGKVPLQDLLAKARDCILAAVPQGRSVAVSIKPGPANFSVRFHFMCGFEDRTVPLGISLFLTSARVVLSES